MRSLLLFAAGLVPGVLAAQDPAANPIVENSDQFFVLNTRHPTTNILYLPSENDHPGYLPTGGGVPADTWLFRVFQRSWQQIGDATTAPTGDQSRISGVDGVMALSAATPVSTTANIYFPAVLVCEATVTPASASDLDGDAQPDLSNIVLLVDETTTTAMTPANPNRNAVLLGWGFTLVDPNTMNSITVDADLTDYAIAVRYHGGDNANLPATGTNFSQGFVNGAGDGFVFAPLDGANPPTPGTQQPLIDYGCVTYDDATGTQTPGALQPVGVFGDARTICNLLLDNPTVNLEADWGTAGVAGVAGTGSGKHYAPLTTAATTGFSLQVFASQFPNGVAVPFLNIGAYFPGAVQVPFGGPLGSPTFEVNPADPLLGALSGAGLTFLDGNGEGQTIPFTLGATPNPAFLGIRIGTELVLWTADPTDDRWDTSGSTWFVVR
jgi:hypothetical protein